MEKNCVILIVEDDPVEQLQIQRILEKTDFQGKAVFQFCAEKAIDWLQSHSVTADLRLILLDLHLPGIEGDEFLAWLKREPKFREYPVVVLSTSNSDQDQQQIRQYDIEDYIVKGIDPELFENQLMQILKAKLEFAFAPTEHR